MKVDGYKDVKLSFATINKWFSYFRHLCVEDNKKDISKIGGEGDIIEIDEVSSKKKLCFNIITKKTFFLLLPSDHVRENEIREG